MVKYNHNSLDLVFNALQDATRREMLERLCQGDIRVTELARPYSMSLPAISKHLSVLENAGLIVRRAEGRERICSLNRERMEEAEEWITRQRRFWDSRFDNLEKLLEEVERSNQADDDN